MRDLILLLVRGWPCVNLWVGVLADWPDSASACALVEARRELGLRDAVLEKVLSVEMEHGDVVLVALKPRLVPAACDVHLHQLMLLVCH